MFSSKSSAYSTKNREDAFILADMLENSAGNHPARELDVQSFFLYNYLRNLIIQSSRDQDFLPTCLKEFITMF